MLYFFSLNNLTENQILSHRMKKTVSNYTLSTTISLLINNNNFRKKSVLKDQIMESKQLCGKDAFQHEKNGAGWETVQ